MGHLGCAFHQPDWRGHKPTPEIAHEAVSLADDLSTGERLEAAHRTRPAFKMLMVALNPLLHHLAFDVLDRRLIRPGVTGHTPQDEPLYTGRCRHVRTGDIAVVNSPRRIACPR